MEFRKFLNEGKSDKIDSTNFKNGIRKAPLKESMDKTIADCRKLYDAMDVNNDKWGDELDNALKAYHKELEKLGYTKENDYTPDYDASDDEWTKYDKIEAELNKKFKIGDINKKYSTEQDKIGNQIWNILKSGIDTVPALRPYKDVLTDEKHKFRIVNKFKDIINKLGLRK